MKILKAVFLHVFIPIFILLGCWFLKNLWEIRGMEKSVYEFVSINFPLFVGVLLVLVYLYILHYILRKKAEETANQKQSVIKPFFKMKRKDLKLSVPNKSKVVFALESDQNCIINKASWQPEPGVDLTGPNPLVWRIPTYDEDLSTEGFSHIGVWQREEVSTWVRLPRGLNEAQAKDYYTQVLGMGQLGVLILDIDGYGELRVPVK